MAQTASRRDFIVERRELMVAFELGWSTWRLAFGFPVGEKPWQVTIAARDVAALSQAIEKARKRYAVPGTAEVFPATRRGGMGSGFTGCSGR